MWNLVLKDLLIQKKTFIITILTCLPLVFAFKGTSGDTSVVYSFVATFTAYAFLTNSFYRDEGAEVMLNSLPINRTTIIISKYLSLLVFVLISMVILFLFLTFAQYTGLTHLSRTINTEGILGGLITVLFLSCILFPVYFKFGYSKTRYAVMVLFLGMFFVFTAFAKIFVKKVQLVSTYLSSIPEITMDFIIITICLVVFSISFILSYTAYKNKDL
ncbi:ABC-2 transporter permease [Clostridium sp. Mt-5]|uniref:ABC-2 transporter permease n=1 Tax=Clostridium moutaii TaxID=3240932 RepID=A0ABV4BNF8_9CLOT